MAHSYSSNVSSTLASWTDLSSSKLRVKEREKVKVGVTKVPLYIVESRNDDDRIKTEGFVSGIFQYDAGIREKPGMEMGEALKWTSPFHT